jgi:NAD(P)H-dependent flavin oxidoreductase YrpB (nitropropane dioxygenase family)
MTLSKVIQGGMGVAVSDWRLARAVSSLGQLGVVSATGIDTVLVRRLQDGDPEGVVRRAMAAFPFQELVASVLRHYFLPDGRAPGTRYKLAPKPTVAGRRSSLQQALSMLGAYVEVFLAKEGHTGPVGVNLLTKIQLPNLASLYGSMLAGVNYVLMGAGIPREIPGALDRLAQHLTASLKLDVTELQKSPGAASEASTAAATFDFVPADFGGDGLEPLRRPDFLPIVASHSLAGVLKKKANGSIEGFVVEGPTAGGHNAPPRVKSVFDGRGQPVYGERDIVDLDKMRELGLPFWLAGGYGSPEGLEDALAHGAAGIQVGTLFAYCRESGIAAELKERVLVQVASGGVDVRTDPRASPTGEVYRMDDGSLGYRCAAEPVDVYVGKGGDVADTVGRKCLCNSLMANVGLGQERLGGLTEAPLLTSGDDFASVARLIGPERPSYTAADVVAYLLGDLEA